MTPALSEDLKHRIIHWYYIERMTMQEISTLALCSVGAVYKVIRNYQDFGEVNNPFSCRVGRPKLLTDDDITFINALVEANPSIYLDEIQQKLYDIRSVDISLPTLSRTLRRLNFTRKMVTKMAAERDDELRAVWEGMMAQYTDPELFVAVDESAVDDRTGQRTQGWSKIGSQCVRRMSFLRGVRYSILPALTVNGIIALEIVEGSITKEIFLKFLHEQVV
jgi:transposase